MSANLEADEHRLLFRAQAMARAIGAYARDKFDSDDLRLHDIENMSDQIGELIERALDKV